MITARKLRLSGLGYTARVNGWVQPQLIRSIQRGTIAIVSAASNTATITAVVTANSRLCYVSVRITGAEQNDTVWARVELTNTTTVTAYRYATSADTTTVSYEVVEYWPGVMRSVQRGTAAQAAGTTNVTITAVASLLMTTVDYLGFRYNSAAASGATNQMTLVLTSTTNVQSISGTANSQQFGYQVIEWWR